MNDFYTKQSEYFYNIKDNLFNLQEKMQRLELSNVEKETILNATVKDLMKNEASLSKIVKNMDNKI